LVPPVIGGLLEDGPASRVGLKAGDIIQSVNNNSINSWSQLSKVLSNLPNETISISVLRGNDTFLYSLRTESFNENNINKGRIGIFASNDLSQWPEEIVVQKKETLIKAFVFGFTETYKFTNLIIVSIGKMISGSVSAENIGGPIQISVLAGSAAKAGLLSFLSMIAILSINLGLINLFPIPVLDGGQLLMIAIEKVKGSPISDNFLEHSLRIGVLLVASLMIFAFVNDIVRLI
jgi:regulator of sigma E protease